MARSEGGRYMIRSTAHLALSLAGFLCLSAPSLGQTVQPDHVTRPPASAEEQKRRVHEWVREAVKFQQDHSREGVKVPLEISELLHGLKKGRVQFKSIWNLGISPLIGFVESRSISDVDKASLDEEHAAALKAFRELQQTPQQQGRETKDSGKGTDDH